MIPVNDQDIFRANFTHSVALEYARGLDSAREWLKEHAGPIAYSTFNGGDPAKADYGVSLSLDLDYIVFFFRDQHTASMFRLAFG